MFAHGVEAIRSQQWFRRYVGTQLLLVPVTLGITFYSLHAAAQAGHGNGRISVLVVGSSLGLLIGSWLWRVVDRVAGVRGMLLGSSTLAVMAAMVCLVAVAFHSWSNVIVNGLVFVMAAAADQAVYTSSIEWVGMFAPEQDRPMLMGFGRALVAAAASVAGVVLGAMARLPDAIWPLIVVLGLSAIALNAALRAPSRG
jgi:MFS family permease